MNAAEVKQFEIDTLGLNGGLQLLLAESLYTGRVRVLIPVKLELTPNPLLIIEYQR